MAKGMTKTALVKTMAERLGLTNKQVSSLLELLAETAVIETNKDGEFAIPGIGKLVSADRSARLGRNAQTGNTINISAKTVVKFRIEKAAKDAITPLVQSRLSPIGSPVPTVESMTSKALLKRIERPETNLPQRLKPISKDSAYGTPPAEHLGKTGAGYHAVNGPLPQAPTFTNQLPFEFFPPGSKVDFERIKSHVTRQYGRHTAPELDWDRYFSLLALNATIIALGKEGWRGYVVYKFPKSSRVLIDCIVQGNAAYVLEGDWKMMIHLTKAEIRSEFRSQHERFFHSGDWLAKVEAALRCSAATFGNRFDSPQQRLARRHK